MKLKQSTKAIVCYFSITLLTFVSACHITFAQSQSIQGIVIDSIAQQPLEGATVQALGNVGQVISTAITNKNGIFVMQANRQLVQTLTISFVQFATKTIALNTTNNTPNIMLGKIQLQYAANALEQVVVQGKKPPVAMRFDKQVYKADTYANAVGGSGIDVLRNLPAISVDAAGAIAFRGSASFLLLVNGKPVQGDPAVMLSQIPSGNIENIEVITNPSAAFDADGRAGVINVVTKNFSQNGWVLQANLMGGFPPVKDYNNARQPQRYSGDISAGYRKDKFDISASLNYLRNDIAGSRVGNVFTIINQVKTSFPSVGERSFKKYNYGGRLLANYELNSKTSFSAGFYSGKRFQGRDANLVYNNSHVNLTNGATSYYNYYNDNTQEKEGKFTLANLSFTHKFSKTTTLALTALYESAVLSGTTYNTNLPFLGSTDTTQFTINPSTNPLDAYRFKADMVSGKWSYGYQFRFDTQNGNFLYLTKTIGNPNFIMDPQFTSRVKATNYMHAGYLQYAGNQQNVQYSTGLRVETTNRTLQFSKDNDTRHLNIVNLFPNAQVKIGLEHKWSLKTGFSSRIRRTNNYELNPFPEREHSETLEQGDPDLLPEYIYNVELGVEKSYKQGSFFATAYNQIIKNPIQRTNSVYNDTILNRVFTNANMANQVGVEIGNTHKITNWWQSVLGFNMYYYTINGSLTNGNISAKNSAWAYTINLSQSFNLGKNWAAQAALNYLSKRPTLQGQDSRFINPSLSIKKTTNDKRWSFQLICLALDAGWNTSNQQRITTSGADFYTTTNYIYEVNQLQFSVSFNMLKQNRKFNLPVSEIGEKEF